MRLLERETQLRALVEYADEARRGQGRLALVSGEAGVGKSTLVERLQAQVPDAGWYWGACDGLFTPRPLGPVVDIAGTLGGELDELVRADAPRAQLFDAMRRALDAPDGLLRVFVVEDVHWADEATLDLLRFLGRRMRDARALVVVTYRDDGLAPGDPLRVVLGELAGQRSTRRVSLPRLSVEAVTALSDGSGLDPRLLHDLTGGNPFFLAEVLRHGVEGLPVTARDAVLARVAGLSVEARQVLEVAALIGGQFPPELLLAVTDAPPAAIDELLDGGALTASSAGELRFGHEIARLAVDQSIGVHRRVPIHRSILDALVRLDADDDACMAYQAEGAGDRQRVLVHAPRAARRASELSAHREAAAQYERALRACAQTDLRGRATFLDALAYEYSLVDRWEDAARTRAQAIDLWRALGDDLRLGQSLGLYSRTMWRLCRGQEAHQAIEEAVAVVEPHGPGAELARATANLASTWMALSRPQDAIAMARRARELAEPLGLHDVLSDALNTEACSTAELLLPWEHLLEESLAVALEHGLHEQAGRAYANLHTMHCALAQLPEAERYYLEGVAYCDDHDISTFGVCLRGQRAYTMAKSGRFVEGAALASSLLARPGAASVNRLTPLLGLALARARRGEAEQWDPLVEVSESTTRLDEPVWEVTYRLAALEMRWLEGDLDGAARELASAEEVVGACDPRLRAEVALWRVRLGSSAAADDADDAADDTPDDTAGPIPPVEPFATWLAGDFACAAEQWDARGMAYDAALALLDSGEEHALREAVARFDAMGAAATARLARQRMRDLGIRAVPNGARASTREHPAGLTRREREVLDLLCEGLTNEGIAERLVIAPKTVDHHVSAVLAKLQVPSRRQAVAEAVRLGLAPASR